MLQTANSPSWLGDVFDAELTPVVQASSGAQVWRIADDKSEATISAQFQANAGEYHRRYAASDHFERLFRQALDQTGVAIPQAPRILDLGSGSGVNSIVPCLRLFPGAQAIATDLSVELLTMLAGYLPQLEAQDSVACVVMDAMGDYVKAEAFDLVTGAAILHHLLNPEQGIQAAARALKRGGKAIFFEPFDGYGLIALAYGRILDEARRPFRRLDRRITNALSAMAKDIAARTQPDRDAPHFPYMDDKWLFAPEDITRMAKAAGFSEVQFIAHNDHASLFRDTAAVQIRLATGLTELRLPDWANTILDAYDAALPGVVKRRMMFEGTIVMTKGE